MIKKIVLSGLISLAFFSSGHASNPFEILCENLEELEKKTQECSQKNTYERIKTFLLEDQKLPNSIHCVNESLASKDVIEKCEKVRLKFGQITDTLIGKENKREILTQLLENECLYYIHDRLGGSYRAMSISHDKLVEETSSLIQSKFYVLFLDYCQKVDKNLLNITFSKKPSWAVIDLKSPTLGFCAAYFGNLEAAKYLVNHVQQQWCQSPHQRIPAIYLATLKKQTSVVSYLLKLEYGYATQAFLGKTKLGQVSTLLSAACFEDGNKEVIDFLFDARLKRVKTLSCEGDWCLYLMNEKGQEEREYLEHALTISFIRNNPQNFHFILKKLNDNNATEELKKLLIKNALLKIQNDEGHPTTAPCYSQHFHRVIRNFMVDQEGKIEKRFEILQTKMFKNIKETQIPFGFVSSWATVLGSSVWTMENKVLLYYIRPQVNELLLKGVSDSKWIDFLTQNEGMSVFKFLFELADKNTEIHEFLRLLGEK